MPAMAVDKRPFAEPFDLSEDDDDDDDEPYFTYRPLSNLPTPPPSSRNSSVNTSPKEAVDDGEPLTTKFLGPAIHLANLIPPSASLLEPSVPLIQAMLTRASLPLETVALAVCILDSLDTRFALTWRLRCPLSAAPSKRHTLSHSPLVPSPPQQPQQAAHIDSVQPEIVVLAALALAAKFLEDRSDPARYYCAAWGRGRWTADQLNATECCVLENLQWRLLPLCDEELLADAMVDMQLAARSWPPRAAGGRRPGTHPAPRGAAARGHRKGRSEAVVVGLGLPLTPVETPQAEAVASPFAA